VKLGVVVLFSFLLAISLRPPLQNRLVLTVSEPHQPRQQFFCDFALCIFAGLITAAGNRIFFCIQLDSGVMLEVGYIAFGFFISLDTALARERDIITDAIARKKEIPPPGKLYSMTRRFLLVALGTAFLVIIILGLVFSRDMAWLSNIHKTGISSSRAMWTVMNEMIFIMGILLILVVNLILSFSKNLKMLFDTETDVLEKVSRGDLSQTVPVATNDEFGLIADYTNGMIQGLRHRFRLISALRMAEEVQRSLLPRSAPALPELDIAGSSIYCDEVGGDYYDYLELPENRLGIVVTDAAGHGVGSALHMTTARAFLRSGIASYRGPAELLHRVNRHLYPDSYETGRFITLFFLEIDTENRVLRWLRAGNDPAILYDPLEDSFTELEGKGISLGVQAEYHFQERERRGWNPGTVILISTDGMRESRNEKDEMFGRERIREILRKHAAESAENIERQLIASLRHFQGTVSQEDDITQVIVRLQ
jgi:sigma-B regulation protein RsbU (phosphoserine phosphatase)